MFRLKSKFITNHLIYLTHKHTRERQDLRFLKKVTANLNTEQPLKTYKDTELIAHYRETNQEKYITELYQRYAHLVYGTCLKYFQNRAESQDMVSNIFIKLLKILSEKEITHFSTFLFTVTRNECISRLRKMKTEASVIEKFTISEKNQANFVENDGAMRLDNEQADEAALLKAALEQLSPEQKECISLFFYENKSYKEIVEMTNYTLSQVKSNLQNGKRNLRIILERS